MTRGSSTSLKTSCSSPSTLRPGLGLAVDERAHVLAVRRGVGAVAHGAELVELEGPAAEPDALLGVEHRAARGELDRQGDGEQDRREHQQRAGGDDDVEGALDAAPARCSPGDAARAHHRRLEEVDEQAPAGERAQPVGDHVHPGAARWPTAMRSSVCASVRLPASTNSDPKAGRPASVTLAQVLGDAGDHALLPAAVDERHVVEALEHGEALAQRLGAVRPADDQRAAHVLAEPSARGRARARACARAPRTGRTARTCPRR